MPSTWQKPSSQEAGGFRPGLCSSFHFEKAHRTGCAAEQGGEVSLRPGVDVTPVAQARAFSRRVGHGRLVSELVYPRPCLASRNL